MTGVEHYREAEVLLTGTHKCRIPEDNEGTPCPFCTRDLAKAQVHATLALAAATALGREGEGGTQPNKDRAAWFAAASECT